MCQCVKCVFKVRSFVMNHVRIYIYMARISNMCIRIDENLVTVGCRGRSLVVGIPNASVNMAVAESAVCGKTWSR